MTLVTRLEIADQVEGLFDGSSIASEDLVQYAAEHGARKEVLITLERLHGDAYRRLPDLWGELRDVPVEL